MKTLLLGAGEVLQDFVRVASKRQNVLDASLAPDHVIYTGIIDLNAPAMSCAVLCEAALPRDLDFRVPRCVCKTSPMSAANHKIKQELGGSRKPNDTHCTIPILG